MASESENFIANLRLICEPYGSSAALARRCGIHKVTLSKYLSGKHVPSLEHAEKLAQGAGLKLRSLLLPPDEFAELTGKKMADAAR